MDGQDGASSEADGDVHSETDAPSDSGPVSAALQGAVQKGPFILGSSVQISAIDGTGSPTGTVFNTSTTDDLGDFEVTFSDLGYVDMQASGFYYDEVTGALSTAPILLRALYDVKTSGPQSAFINIVTHLAHDRAASLMGGGMTLEDAETQAESELVSALGIGGVGFAPGGAGISLNELGGDSDRNAYLFAVSSIMVEIAIQQGGTSLDAQLQELLDTVASDLVASRTLPLSVTSEILAAEEALDVDLTVDLFSSRLQSIGSDATPANLDRAVDSDGDGYRNTADTCPLVANPVRSVLPAGVLCAVTRHTTFLPASASFATLIVSHFENTGHPGALVDGPAGWSLLLGDGTGRFAAPFAVTLPASFTPAVAYDLNKDGNPDLVGSNGWVAGDGAGHFGSPSAFGSSDLGAQDALGVAVADFNRDAIPDVAVLSSTGVNVVLATAPGTFGSPIVSPLPFAGTWLFANDVNHDGKLDLVEVGFTTTGIAVALLGDGTGHFQPAIPITLTASGNWAAVADFDGDGNVDIAASDVGSLQVAFGDGNGGFGSLATTSVSSQAVAVGDYNSDGMSDVWFGFADCPIGIPPVATRVGVLLSQGRVFGSPQSLHATPDECGIVLVSQDLNGDGTPDAVSLNQAADGTWNLQGYVVGELPDDACANTMCGGACVDTTNNVFNCGQCGHACDLGATCAGSVCGCSGADTVCGGSCVDENTNNDNCGMCGYGCPGGQSCESGVCSASCSAGSPCYGGAPTAIEYGASPRDLAVDSTSVYWTDETSLVMSVPIGGGTPTTLASGQAYPTGIVVDGSRVFWTDQGPGANDGTIMSVPKGGGTPATLASVAASPLAIAADDTNVYFAEVAGVYGAIVSLPKTGGTPTTLVAYESSPQSIAVDSTSVYWADYDGLVMKIPLGGGTATMLAATPKPFAVAVYSTNVYWTDQNLQAVMSVPIGGGAVTTLASAQQNSFGIAVDATGVYWTTNLSAGTVVNIPLGGGTPVTLASGQGNPIGIALDATSVYWADFTGPTVMKETPK